MCGTPFSMTLPEPSVELKFSEVRLCSSLQSRGDIGQILSWKLAVSGILVLVGQTVFAGFNIKSTLFQL